MNKCEILDADEMLEYLHKMEQNGKTECIGILRLPKAEVFVKDIEVPPNVMSVSTDIEGNINSVEYSLKINKNMTELEKQMGILFDESIPGENITEFLPFITSENLLPLTIRNEFSMGRKCVWVKKQHYIFPAMGQLTFKGKDGKCYILYLGVLYSSTCILINVTEYHSKVMKKYGKWWNGELYLDRGESKSKVPLFTKIFEEDQNMGKPYFMPEGNQTLMALQVSDDTIQEEKDIFNVIGGMLTLCQSLVNEINGAELNPYSFADDFKAALRIFWHLY